MIEQNGQGPTNEDIERRMMEPATLWPALKEANDELGLKALTHFRDLVRHAAYEDSLTGYRDFSTDPQVRAELIWVQTARNIWDTAMRLPRDEGLAVVASMMRQAAAVVAQGRVTEVVQEIVSSMKPADKTTEQALADLTGRTLEALTLAGDDPEQRRAAVSLALQAARQVGSEKGSGQYL